jgi:Uma2 family endonuclease
MSIAGKLMTAEEFEALPDDGVRRELIEGQIQVMSPASLKYGWIGAKLLRHIGSFAEANSLGETFNSETGYRVASDPDTVLVPDGAFISKHRISRVWVDKGFGPEPPDLVFEVISPSQTRNEQLEKGRRWVKAGCEVVWVVDPEANQIVVLEGDSVTVLSEGQELTAFRLLPGFSLKLEELFRMPS